MKLKSALQGPTHPLQASFGHLAESTTGKRGTPVGQWEVVMKFEYSQPSRNTVKLYKTSDFYCHKHHKLSVAFLNLQKSCCVPCSASQHVEKKKQGSDRRNAGLPLRGPHSVDTCLADKAKRSTGTMCRRCQRNNLFPMFLAKRSKAWLPSTILELQK